MLLLSSLSGFFHAKRFTAETWHINGSNRMARAAATPAAVKLQSSVLLTDRLHSSMSPLSIPTARNPSLFLWWPRPTQDNAVTLLLNTGKVISCLTEDPPWSTAQIFTVLSREPVANSWPYGFQAHDQIILLCASCLAKSWQITSSMPKQWCQINHVIRNCSKIP